MKKSDVQKVQTKPGQFVEALDKLGDCKCEIDFLAAVFRGGGPPCGIENVTEGLFFLLQRIGRDMEESLEKLSRKEVNRDDQKGERRDPAKV